MEKNIKIQQALFFSFLKKLGLKNKKTINMRYSTIVLIKMRLLMFSVFSQYGLACKYGIILQISTYNISRILFSDTWHKNCQSSKAITEPWSNLLFKLNMFLACLFLDLILFKVGISPSKKVVFICFSEILLKMMKNAFYFLLIALLVLEISKLFVVTFWLCRKMVWWECKG